MQDNKRNVTFDIDGYEISATFASSLNTAVVGQVKQILLSSFASNSHNNRRGDILAIIPEQRDNIGGGRHYVP